MLFLVWKTDTPNKEKLLNLYSDITFQFDPNEKVETMSVTVSSNIDKINAKLLNLYKFIPSCYLRDVLKQH